jgi:hypothetical protein
MIDETQLARLAGMAHALRPDWPSRSLLTYLHAHHAGRPYRDLAVALAWVAADSATRTPARLDENGPWWKAALAEAPDATRTPSPTPVCKRCGHFVTEPNHGEHCARRVDPDHARTMRDQAVAAARAAPRPKETTP